eukprot:scaffold181108_cov32-Prasinocladus_malaysianus.AAC.1
MSYVSNVFVAARCRAHNSRRGDSNASLGLCICRDKPADDDSMGWSLDKALSASTSRAFCGGRRVPVAWDRAEAGSQGGRVLRVAAGQDGRAGGRVVPLHVEACQGRGAALGRRRRAVSRSHRAGRSRRLRVGSHRSLRRGRGAAGRRRLPRGRQVALICPKSKLAVVLRQSSPHDSRPTCMASPAPV